MGTSTTKSHLFLFYLKLGLGAFVALLGCLLYLFFRNYSGEKIPYPTLWYLAGALLVMAGVAWAVYTIRREIRLEKAKERLTIDALRNSAMPIWVNLARCEVISSSLAPNEVNEDGDDTYSVIKFVHEGKPYYSANIYKDVDTIRLKMELQKQTALYIHPNGSEYYLDTDFLEE